jgi:uncharacterized lipoprotein NlpE involved in copper resistance
MYKVISFLTAALMVFVLGGCQRADKAVDAAHNSRNSVNWEGVYTGTIPAADAEGINVTITLNTDETYEIRYEYIGKTGEFIDKGTFKWDQTGSIVTLNSTNMPPYYKVGENILIQLDMQGQLITGKLADQYVLRKTP